MPETRRKLTIAIDFDGTVVENMWPAVGKPMPGAIEVIRALKASGHMIIMWTCRGGERLTDAMVWCEVNGVPVDHWNDNSPERVELFGSNTRKVGADVYIDDKNLGGFPGWLFAGILIAALEKKYE